MSGPLHLLVEPGLLSSAPVRSAIPIGLVTALVSAVVGVFTVARNQSFAGHGLTDVATTGGSAAFLLNFSPLLGFVGAGLAGAGAMELLGAQRARSRDVATGIVLGAATGVSALLLYLGATTRSTTGAAQQILFGSIFTVPSSIFFAVAGLGATTVAVIALIYRPLLLSSLSPDIASANGVNTRLVGFAFAGTMAVSVGLSSIAVGSILSTSLLIGPAATALRITRTLRSALVSACAIGMATTFVGIVLAYDSSFWDPNSQGLPVSFFIVAVTVAGYLASGASGASRARRR